MELATAKTAGTLAAQIEILTEQIDRLLKIQTEMNATPPVNWLVTECAIEAPPEGSEIAGGTMVDLGDMDYSKSKRLLGTRIVDLQAELNALNAELAALA